MKKINLVALFAIFATELFAIGSKNQRLFVGGNIQDKTTAVKQASEQEVTDLAKAAIEFSINYKEIMGEDRDLAALAVAGTIALPADYLEKTTPAEKDLISQKFLTLFSIFEDNTVKISVLNKLSSCKMNSSALVDVLNNFIKTENPESYDPSLIKSMVGTVGSIGNEESFKILFNLISDSKWAPFKDDLTEAIRNNAENSDKEVLALISAGNIVDLQNILNLFIKNSKKTELFDAQIAENVLSRCIYIMENTNSCDEELIKISTNSFNLLVEKKWTRASNTGVLYFKTAIKLYSAGLLNDQEFAKIISGVVIVSPIASIQPLSSYLAELNRQMEKKETPPSDEIVLSIINSLGAVGDKNAFDALLGVTYYEYSDSVVAAARDALAKLKW